MTRSFQEAINFLTEVSNNRTNFDYIIKNLVDIFGDEFDNFEECQSEVEAFMGIDLTSSQIKALKEKYMCVCGN